MRIVVLSGGFGGVATVRHLERVLRRRTNIEITLVSRENFFVLTPLLFEACSGRLELRHYAQPIRAALQRARFIEATVESVEIERQLVRAVAPEGDAYDLPYDHLVVALGASTNDRLVPPWPRSAIRAQSRECSVCDSRASSPGGCGGPTTSFRCRAGTAPAHCPRSDRRTFLPAGHHAG
jgi:NADH dehydrogenase FAD-containing subunit